MPFASPTLIAIRRIFSATFFGVYFQFPHAPSVQPTCHQPLLDSLHISAALALCFQRLLDSFAKNRGAGYLNTISKLYRVALAGGQRYFPIPIWEERNDIGRA
jgi:hypothetical protein